MADNDNDGNSEVKAKQLVLFRKDGSPMNVRIDKGNRVVSKSRAGKHQSRGWETLWTEAGDEVHDLTDGTFEVENTGEILTATPPKKL